jgi:hypothetical protein
VTTFKVLIYANMAFATIAAVSRMSSIRRADELADARGDTEPKAERHRRVRFTRLERASLGGMLASLVALQAVVLLGSLKTGQMLYPRYGWVAYRSSAMSAVLLVVTVGVSLCIATGRLPRILGKRFSSSRDGDA